MTLIGADFNELFFDVEGFGWELQLIEDFSLESRLVEEKPLGLVLV